MIEEDYVSFETAKLLKEKGFKIPYDSLRGMYINGIFKRLNPGGPYGYNLGDEIVEVCSLQMAMKWLREVHHLFIGCEPRLSFTDFYWITANIYRVRKKSSLYHTEDVDDYHCVACCDSDSYEDACESAIKYCLEKLI